MLERKMLRWSLLDTRRVRVRATLDYMNLSTRLSVKARRPFHMALGMGNVLKEDSNVALALLANQSKGKLRGIGFSIDNRFDRGIDGFCTGVFCQNNDGPLNGVSASLVGSVTGGLKGVAASVVSTAVEGDARGVAFSGIYNVAGLEKHMRDGAKVEKPMGDVKGMSFGGVVNYSSETAGWAHGTFVNVLARGIRGLATGLVVRVREAAEGMMLSCVGICDSFRGVMVGLVNVCREHSSGLQIGLLNIRMDAPWYAKAIPGIAVRLPKKMSELKKEGQF